MPEWSWAFGGINVTAEMDSNPAEGFTPQLARTEDMALVILRSLMTSMIIRDMIFSFMLVGCMTCFVVYLPLQSLSHINLFESQNQLFNTI